MALLIIGCAEPVASPSGESAPLLAGAPAEVDARTPLPACGEETAHLDGRGLNLEGRACFWQAVLEGRPAEFISRGWTVEGDPVLTVYRTLADSTGEEFYDGTRDRWGDGAWTFARCMRFVQLDIGPHFQFGGEDCEFRELDPRPNAPGVP